jgi:GntR family transcriptional regulator/MocR family aminotransferase
LLHRIWRRPRAGFAAVPDAFGWPQLRAAIARHLGEWRGILSDGEQIIITSGVVDATDLIVHGAFAPRDVIYVEEPGHPTLRRALQRSGVVPHPALVDTDGFDIDRAIQSRGARGAIVTPSRQFPLGATLPLRRRLAMLEWASSVQGYVVEDDFDGEYRYQGLPLPALMSLDRHSRAIYIGSFSKVLSPALRLGFIVIPEHLIGSFRHYLKVRGTMASLFLQPVLAELLDEGAYATHIRRTRRIYAQRLRALLAWSHRLDGLLELCPVSAGMHVVADLAAPLAERMSDGEAAKRAEAAGIIVPPLADFYALRPRRRALLLGFAGFSEEASREALGRLAEALSPR